MLSRGRIYRLVLLLLNLYCALVTGKWVEGHLKTTENWAFLSRFCFLSLEGQFEYQIEFDRGMEQPNLLLYYDEESQWPSVYHSDKTCQQREDVLNNAGQNQVIKLSHWYPDNDSSGCVLRSANRDLPASKSTTTTELPRTNSNQTTGNRTQVSTLKSPTEDPAYYDQFLKTTQSLQHASPSPATLKGSDDTTFYNVATVAYNASTEGVDEEYQWETIGDENMNDSDIRSNLKDVEVMFDESTGDKPAAKIKRFIGPTSYTHLRNRKLSASPLRAPRSDASRGERVTLVVSCHNVRRFRSARERWWFVAISNCKANKGLDVKYKFLMTNGAPGDFWHEHFSADEFYVLPILLTYCMAYMLVLLVVAMCTMELRSRHLLHTTYKLFVASVVFQHSGIIMQCLAYARYASNGVGNEGAKVVGQFFCGLSEMGYLLLLVLMAKGYTITRARLKVGFTVRLTCFMCSYAVTYISLFIWQSQVFDPGQVLYLYESPAGYGLIVLRIVAWFMFICAVIFTMRKYPEKTVFYCPFTICGTLWFYAGPVFILVANSYIDKWVRESVVIAVLHFITFAGHITFLLLTLPVFANKNFPYHVRTTQIGVMAVRGESDTFTHSMYQPGNSAAPPQTVIIPLTRRTEELIGNMYSQYMASAPPLSLEDHNSQSSLVPKTNGLYHDSNTRPLTQNGSVLPKQESSDSNNSDDAPNNHPNGQVLKQNGLNSVINGQNGLANGNGPENGHSIFSIESQMNIRNSKLNLNGQIGGEKNGVTSPISTYDFENDPKYIRDVNNPFLISANMKARRNLLQPLDRDDTAAQVPQWSLAKGYGSTSSRGSKRKKSLKMNSCEEEDDIPTIIEIDQQDSKKMPPSSGTLGTKSSGEISTIHEGLEPFAGTRDKSGFVNVDLFAAGPKD